MYATVLKHDSNPSRSYIQEGDRLVSYLFTVGVLNEAFDAFRALERNKKFQQQPILAKNETYQNFFAKMKALSDKENPESFYSRHISPTRDEAVFHWSLNSLKKMVEEIENTNAESLSPLLVSYGPSSMDERLPIFDRLLFRLVRWEGTSAEDLNRVVKETRDALYTFLLFVVSLIKCLFLNEQR